MKRPSRPSHDCFGQDRARAVAGAEKQDVEGRRHCHSPTDSRAERSTGGVGTPGFLARINALANLSPTSAAIASTSTPSPVRNSRASSHVVDARRLDADLLESGRCKLARYTRLLERAGDAADPEQHARDGRLGHAPRVTTSDTAKRPPGFRTRNASRSTASLSRREIDDAVRNDDVDRAVGQRNLLDLSFQKLDVLRARFSLVFARERQHVVRHVEPVGLARGADAPRREQNVDAAAGAEIKNGLAFLEARRAQLDCRSRARL